MRREDIHVGIITGSGSSELFKGSLSIQESYTFAELNIPESTVPGHSNRVIVGETKHETRIAVCLGRLHHYEGWSMQVVVKPIEALLSMGAKKIILVNASGSLRPDLDSLGDIVVISDHVSMPLLSGLNPLHGLKPPCFVSLHDAYEPKSLDLVNQCIKEHGLDLRARSGVYAQVGGPSYETPAESRFLRDCMHADVVGMSTVPEVIYARSRGIKPVVLSVVTNFCTLDQEVSHQEVLAAARSKSSNLERLILNLADALVKSE